MDAKIRFDDEELEAAKVALGTRSNRKAIMAVLKAGMRAVRSRSRVNPSPRKRAGDRVFENVPDAIRWMKSL